jgi:hypothetical protein
MLCNEEVDNDHFFKGKMTIIQVCINVTKAEAAAQENIE